MTMTNPMPRPGHAGVSRPPGLGAAKLASAPFSTDAFEARHRFDAWSSEFGTLNDIILPREDRAGFQARCTAWRLGAFTIAASETPAMTMSRGPRHAARDGLDHWVLRVARKGSVRTRLGDARFETQPRQLVSYSVASGFEGEWSPAEWVTLWIPRDASSTLTAGLSLRAPGPRMGVGAAVLADMLLTLPEHLARADASEAATITEAITSLVSTCLLRGPASAAEELTDAGAPSLNPLLRERVRRVIRDNIGSARLTPERIARAAGVSRSALYRIMEPEGGVARHVQRVRLAMVHAALSDPDCSACSIATLAEQHGFHDPSAFARAFRRAFGCTPSDVRANPRRDGMAPMALGGPRYISASGASFAPRGDGRPRDDEGPEQGSGALSRLLRSLAAPRLG